MEKIDFMGNWKRTCLLTELNATNCEETVTLMGWVNKRRNLGNLIFIDLRDVSGIIQVVFNPEISKEIHEKSSLLRAEFVIALKGIIKKRPAEMINKNIKTGEIEIIAEELKILNYAETPPFEINESLTVNEDLRLTYRYLDLRNQKMKNNIILRHDAMQATREFLNKNGFFELETPILMKSTPEGARDFLVPSRVNKGEFYALPQSPQLYKQIYMISGFDKYYQIAKCFRDEDMRADRQPEFTQIDIEMSFTDQEEVFKITEGLFQNIFKKCINKEIEKKFPRLTYKQAMDKYGTDKPDLRFNLELTDITEVFKESDFILFKNALENKGIIKGILLKNKAGDLSRKKLDAIQKLFDHLGNNKLLFFKYQDNEFKTGITKNIKESEQQQLKNILKLENNDIYLLSSGNSNDTNKAMSFLRNYLAKEFNIINENDYKFVWITDYPLFEWDEELKKWTPMHHMFTMPKQEHIPYLDSDPGKVEGELYDLVVNGIELCSGSIRVHRKDIQDKIFKIIGMSSEEVQKRFGFFINSLKYGTPPHGGIAPGLDRIIMLLSKEDNIRDVIAFPKTLTARGLMEGSPSPVEKELLEDDLLIQIIK